jgi:hypothetical protein
MKPRGVIVYLADRLEAKRVPLLLQSLHSMEEYFNRLYHYPVIIFHLDYTEHEKRLISSSCSSKITFVQLNESPLPSDLRSRFYLGLMLMHPALDPYEYYWRFDEDSFLLERLTYDPFEVMQDGRYMYGYRSIVGEKPQEDEKELWRYTCEFARRHKLPLRHLKKMCGDWLGRYRGQHFYNHFEICNIPFWRGSGLYREYFAKLDSGFKRPWDEGEVRTFACYLLLRPDQIHHFDDIGYRHKDHYSCMKSAQVIYRGACD